MGVDPATLDAAAVGGYVGKAEEQSVTGIPAVDHPDTFAGALTGGADPAGVVHRRDLWSQRCLAR
jgi:hypothetical protein